MSRFVKDLSWTTGNHPHVSHKRRIGGGGFAEVHEMINEKENQTFARKIFYLYISDEDIEQEIRAARNLCTAGHPNIVSILNHGTFDTISYCFMDMELCDLSLDDYIHRRSTFVTQRPTLPNGPVFVSQDCSTQVRVHNLYTIMHQIAEGIEFIHVLYSHQKKLWKITDFGLASSATTKIAVTTRYSRGTEGYRAPELLREDAKFTKMVDVWALACILYELATGEKAFRNDFVVREFKSIAHLKNNGSSIPKAILSDLSQCLREMLDVDPQLRPHIFTLRRFFESCCIILNPLIVHNLDDFEFLPFYNTWKKLAIQDTENLVLAVCDWFESRGEVQVVGSFLEVLNRSTNQRILQEELAESYGTTRSSDGAMTSNVAAGGHGGCTLGGNIKYRGSRLRIAAWKGQKNVIESLLISGVDVNTANQRRETALHYAAKFGYKDVAETLMRRGANVNPSDIDGRTPLHSAVESDQIKMIELLLNAGATINAKTRRCEQTPIMWPARHGNEKVAELLLRRGADFKDKDTSGWAPLSLAARHGHEKVVELLLEAGANLEDKVHIDGRTVFGLAAQHGHEKVAESLLKAGADVHKKDHNGRGLISWAAEGGHQKMVEFLLKADAIFDEKDKQGWTPIVWAAGTGHDRVVELLLNRGADFEVKDSHGMTPLSFAAKNGHRKVVELLLRVGAEFKKSNISGRTPIILAAKNGHRKVVELLLKAGATFEDLPVSRPPRH